MNRKSIVSFSTIASLTRKLSLSLFAVGYLIAPAWGAKLSTIKPEIINIEDDGEQVTLQVKVKGEGNQPILDLSKENFKLEVFDTKTKNTYKNLYFTWESPREATPPPAFIVVLLDFSGSMNCPQNLKIKCDKNYAAKGYAAKGNRKLDAAIEALNKFIELASERKEDTQVSIVPFGIKGSDPTACNYPDPVDKNTLNNFNPVQDAKLAIFLKELTGKTPCAYTSLYKPLKETVKFLANDKDTQFYPKDKEGNPVKPQPRLSIILLSDGFDNASSSKDIDKTLAELKNNQEIIVHTLGYGLTPEELGKKYSLGRPAKRSDLNSPKLSKENREALEKEFVDKQQLEEIAYPTGGITDFAGDADEIAKKLELFLDAIFGQYEITYTQPNAERERKIEVKVFAQNAPSEPKQHILTGFGRSVPGKFRLIVLGGTLLALGVGGVLPFYFWGKKLKEEN